MTAWLLCDCGWHNEKHKRFIGWTGQVHINTYHPTLRLIQFSYRAFSCHVKLSSNMAASIATEISIHLCKHLFTLLSVTVSPWTSPFVVQAHDDRVRAWCTWLPWIYRLVYAIWRPRRRTAWTSVKTLYTCSSFLVQYRRKHLELLPYAGFSPCCHWGDPTFAPAPIAPAMISPTRVKPGVMIRFLVWGRVRSKIRIRVRVGVGVGVIFSR